MKISYRSKPVLRFLEIDKPEFFYLKDDIPDGEDKERRFYHFFCKRWASNRGTFKGNINILSQSFADAIDESKSKLWDQALYFDFNAYKGCLLFGEVALCYNLERIADPIENKFTGTIILFIGEVLKVFATGDSIYYYGSDAFSSHDPIEGLRGLYGMAQSFEMFKKYAEVQVHQLGPNKKRVALIANM